MDLRCGTSFRATGAVEEVVVVVSAGCLLKRGMTVSF